MKLSVIILNYNVRYFLELCLKSVLEATQFIDAEIIVIDNNSKDDSRDMVARLFPAVRWIQNTDNVGFSKANNQAVREASGDYLCILNPDTVVSEDTFTKLIQFAERKDDIGIVGCKLIDGTGNYLPESKRNVPYVSAAIKKMFGQSQDYYANHLSPEDIGPVDILVGAFMFVKRSVYNQINGFDEDYFMYGEDIDISYKALKAGFQNFYYGDTTVIHYKGESTLKDKKYAKRFYGAMLIFYRKHFKNNRLFDAFVWFGLKVAFALPKSTITKKKMVKQYYFIGDKQPENLGTILNHPILSVGLEEVIPDLSEVVLDANALTYKEIIAYIERVNRSKDLSFKILPKDAQYIIGSDDSINQGEVIPF